MTQPSRCNRLTSPLPAMVVWLLTAVPLVAAERVVNVRDLGAVPDGKTLCTEAIQQAIDRCGAAGGGTVYFPPGTYLSGTLFLKSHVTLHLEAGATLLGSTRLADYPLVKAKVPSRTNALQSPQPDFRRGSRRHFDRRPRHARRQRRRLQEQAHDGRRPLMLRVINCRDVLVENIQMQNSGFWNQHYLACRRVRVQGIRVFNHATYNADGIDIDGCRDFVVSNSFIDSDDDAVCLKSTSDRPCENVLISNCVISSHCNADQNGHRFVGRIRERRHHELLDRLAPRLEGHLRVAARHQRHFAGTG